MKIMEDKKTKENMMTDIEEEEEIDIIAVQKEIDNLEAELAEVQVKMKEYLKELGM